MSIALQDVRVWLGVLIVGPLAVQAGGEPQDAAAHRLLREEGPGMGAGADSARPERDGNEVIGVLLASPTAATLQ